jgi:hypothetical protein
MRVKTEDLRCGDILTGAAGDVEVREVFELPSGGAGRVSNMIKLTVRRDRRKPDLMGIYDREWEWDVKRP